MYGAAFAPVGMGTKKEDNTSNISPSNRGFCGETRSTDSKDHNEFAIVLKAFDLR